MTDNFSNPAYIRAREEYILEWGGGGELNRSGKRASSDEGVPGGMLFRENCENKMSTVVQLAPNVDPSYLKTDYNQSYVCTCK